jgi:hypothetical protein
MVFGCTGSQIGPREDLSQSERGVAVSCDGSFHWMGVAGTECLDGSATGFVYRCFHSATAPLVINMDGGGACGWPMPVLGMNSAGDTCQCGADTDGVAGFNAACPPQLQTNHFGPSDITGYVDQIFAEALYSGPTSPFNTSWNQVFIPYCTGDVHTGNAVVALPLTGGGVYSAHFKGYSNVTLDIPQIVSLFPAPSKIAIWGSSAGALGSDCNLPKFRAANSTWRSVPMYEMNNSGAPLEPGFDPQTSSVAQAWGVWQQLGTVTVTAYICNPYPNCSYQQVASYPYVGNNTCGAYSGAGLGSWTGATNTQYNLLNPETASIYKGMTDSYSDATMNLFAGLMGATTYAGTEPQNTLNDTMSYYIDGSHGINAFSFSGTSTTTTSYNFVLHAGEAAAIGDCGLPGSSFSGNTFLRLFDPTGALVASNDNGPTGLTPTCGTQGSYITYTPTKTGEFTVQAGCVSGSCGGTVESYVDPKGWVTTAVAFAPTFSASNTNSAQQNTVSFPVQQPSGMPTSIGASTCNAFTGDTYLRLYDTTNTLITSNDNAGGSCGNGSSLNYTPGGTSGFTGSLKVGCSGAGACTGTVALSASAPVPTFSSISYSASSTNSALINAPAVYLTLFPGETVDLGTCGINASAFSGNTYLRLFDPSGAAVASNDDACGGLGSRITYTVPANGAIGPYALRVGCSGAGACSGTVTGSETWPQRYKVYFNPDTCHAEREEDSCKTGSCDPCSDSSCGLTTCGTACDPHDGSCGPPCEISCNYDNMTESGVNFNDWVREWIQAPGYTTWVNVL